RNAWIRSLSPSFKRTETFTRSPTRNAGRFFKWLFSTDSIIELRTEITSSKRGQCKDWNGVSSRKNSFKNALLPQTLVDGDKPAWLDYAHAGSHQTPCKSAT